jgi:phage gp36-like protein
MANYVTVDDMVKFLGRRTMDALADQEGNDGYDEAYVQGAIDQAESEIDGVIGTRYSTPLTITAQDDPIKGIARVLCRWYLFINSIQPEGFNEFLRDAWQADAVRVREMLKKYAEGAIVIPGQTPRGTKAKWGTGDSGTNVQKEFTMPRQDKSGNEIETTQDESLTVW